MRETNAAAKTLWAFHCVYHPLAAAEAIVGLGSYDVRVASRCAALFHEGYAKTIVFTGAAGNWTKDLYHTNEAEAFKRQAMRDGVPEHAIIVEPRATNIGENMRFCAELLPNATQVILVTKPQTQQRCLATANKQWPQVRAQVTAPHIDFEDQPLPHHPYHDLVCEMVGDLERMQTYAQRGFQTEVPIPETVHTAFDLLVAAGFTRHLSEDRLKK